jgi:hypothetical protein
MVLLSISVRVWVGVIRRVLITVRVWILGYGYGEG